MTAYIPNMTAYIWGVIGRRHPWMGRVGRVLLLPAAALTVTLPLDSLPTPGPTGSALRAYVTAVEPIRDGVNNLLDGADRLLRSWRAHTITGSLAGAAMSTIEQRFAVSMAQINGLRSGDPTLDRLNVPYAETYILEDAYLRSLASALPGGNFSTLPKTAEQQRRTIVAWRNHIERLARQLRVPLPKDFDHAGRGDIAPSPFGS
jgi:hypothetical protein